MTERGAPLRFVAVMLSLWGVGRAVWLIGDPIATPAEASKLPIMPQSTAPVRNAPALLAWLPSFRTANAPSSSQLTIALPAAEYFGQDEPAPPITPAFAGGTVQQTSYSEILTPGAPSPAPRLDLDQAVRSASRWSGSAWVYARERNGARSLVASGQLGGSQAGARLRWRLNPGEQLRTALYGRVSSPLEDSAGAEAAFGAEWHPLPGQPFWIAGERRVALGKQGRNAWSAYAAGGVWRPGLPLNLTLDGYAQAGVVGAKRRDLFADGALRLSRPVSREGGPRVGGGVWGAAQPGVARLDIGPHARIPLKVAKQPLSISADYRIRVAGDAKPGSGVAVTLASDF